MTHPEQDGRSDGADNDNPDTGSDRTDSAPTDAAHSDSGSQAERNREDESPA